METASHHSGRFLPDLISSCFPLGLVFAFANFDTSGLNLVRLVKLVRLLRVSRLARMLQGLTSQMPTQVAKYSYRSAQSESPRQRQVAVLMCIPLV